jgi:hypothetical protein
MSVPNAPEIKIRETFFPNKNIENREYILGDAYHRMDGPAVEEDSAPHSSEFIQELGAVFSLSPRHTCVII